MQTFEGIVKIIDSRTGYAICVTNGIAIKRYFFFKISDCQFELKEEDQVNWCEEPHETLSLNNIPSAIGKAIKVQKIAQR